GTCDEKEGRAARPRRTPPGTRRQARAARLGFGARFGAGSFAGTLDETAHCFGRLRSAFYPVSHPFLIELETRWIAWVMIPDGLNVAAITFGPLLRHDDTIKGLLLRPHSSQSDR